MANKRHKSDDPVFYVYEVSDETRRKIIQANTGRKQTDIARANMSAAHVGKTLPAAVRKKQSAAQRASWETSDRRAKSDARWSDPAFREKMSIALRKKAPATEEHRAKLRAASLAAWAKRKAGVTSQH